MNEIVCTNLAELAEVAAELTKQGVRFHASTANLKIFITGY